MTVHGGLHGVVRAALAVRRRYPDLAPLGGSQGVTRHRHPLQVSSGLVVVEALCCQRIRLTDPQSVAARLFAHLVLLVPPQAPQDILLRVGTGVLVAPFPCWKDNNRSARVSTPGKRPSPAQSFVLTDLLHALRRQVALVAAVDGMAVMETALATDVQEQQEQQHEDAEKGAQQRGHLDGA